MIHNNRKSGLLPRALRDAAEELEDIAKTGDKTKIKDTVYKGKRRVNGRDIFEVRRELRRLYYNKCAYCESKEHKPEVEHYRPKSQVKEDKGYSGYYWLCYEWTNLIPACHDCNTNGAKGTQFPIMGQRVVAPRFNAQGQLDKEACTASNEILRAELPYLLHPEIDNPKPFFQFEPTGSITGVDQDGRGEKTIDICKLRRENLLYQRKKLIDDFVKGINRTFRSLEKKIVDLKLFKEQLFDVFEDMDIATASDQEFSLLAQYIREHFDKMIGTHLSKNKLVVCFAYKNYRKLFPL